MTVLTDPLVDHLNKGETHLSRLVVLGVITPLVLVIGLLAGMALNQWLNPPVANLIPVAFGGVQYQVSEQALQQWVKSHAVGTPVAVSPAGASPAAQPPSSGSGPEPSKKD